MSIFVKIIDEKNAQGVKTKFLWQILMNWIN